MEAKIGKEIKFKIFLNLTTLEDLMKLYKPACFANVQISTECPKEGVMSHYDK